MLEEACEHIHQFCASAAKLGLMGVHDIVEIAFREAQDSLEDKEGEELAQAQETFKEKSWGLVKSGKKLFAPFEHALGATLAAKWAKIMEDQCFGETHMAKGGVRRNGPQGTTQLGLKACIMVSLLEHCHPNAAKRQRKHMQVQIKMPVWGVSVEQCMPWVTELNTHQPLLPS